MDLDQWGWVRKLAPGCFAETMLCTIRGGHFPGGTYTVLYEGQGKLEVGKNARLKESQPGRLRVEVDFSKGGGSLQLKETNPANYVRNIRLIMPGFERRFVADPFHPAFLQRWKGFACFRFMDWMHTNGSEQKSWNDRPTLRHATFSKRGVPLEWMIELCNRQQAAAWFCMPHQADDNYVRNFATMVRDLLDPRLRIYVEYSNEVWNWQFKQAHYASERGVALGLAPKDKGAQAAWFYTALRSVEIFKIWEEVLGGRDRLVRVLPSQAGNTAVSEAVLGFRNAAAQADALVESPFLNYRAALRTTAATNAQVLAAIREPYYDRTYAHYCSHQNTPYRLENAPHPGAVQKGRVVFLPHRLGEMYYTNGARLHRQLFVNALERIYSKPMLRVDLPSAGRATLLHQPESRRYVVHLLYGPPIERGRCLVIEDLPVLRKVRVELRVNEKVRQVKLVPPGKSLRMTRADGVVRVIVPEFQCHTAIAYQY